MSGEAITLWTIRAALACAFVAALLVMVNPSRERHARLPLLLWTVACGLFLGHVAAAFHYYHNWTHALAVQDTAQRTADLIGWRFGGGVYFNYLFGVLWLCDVLLLWHRKLQRGASTREISSSPKGASPDSEATVHPLRIAWIVFFLFMVVNGAIVFVSGPVRWIAAAALLVLATVWLLVDRRVG